MYASKACNHGKGQLALFTCICNVDFGNQATLHGISSGPFTERITGQIHLPCRGKSVYNARRLWTGSRCGSRICVCVGGGEWDWCEGGEWDLCVCVWRGGGGE